MPISIFKPDKPKIKAKAETRAKVGVRVWKTANKKMKILLLLVKASKISSVIPSLLVKWELQLVQGLAIWLATEVDSKSDFWSFK